MISPPRRGRDRLRRHQHRSHLAPEAQFIPVLDVDVEFLNRNVRRPRVEVSPDLVPRRNATIENPRFRRNPRGELNWSERDSERTNRGKREVRIGAAESVIMREVASILAG